MPVCAEDAAAGFMPSPGPVRQLSEPGGPGVRIDGYVYEGYDIPIHYDPMISKLIVHADTRERAIARMRRALDEYRITGVKTNIGYLSSILGVPDFERGSYDTSFLEKNAVLLGSAAPQQDERPRIWPDRGVYELYRRYRERRRARRPRRPATRRAGGANSASARASWACKTKKAKSMEVQIADRTAEVELIEKNGNGIRLSVDGKAYDLDMVMTDRGICSVLCDGRSYDMEVERREGGKNFTVNSRFASYEVSIVDAQAGTCATAGATTPGRDNDLVRPHAGQGGAHRRGRGRPASGRRHGRRLRGDENAEHAESDGRLHRPRDRRPRGRHGGRASSCSCVST